MKKFLVVCDPRSGFCELRNVGVFEADDKGAATKMAKQDWGVVSGVTAFDIDELPAGWSYYL